MSESENIPVESEEISGNPPAGGGSGVGTYAEMFAEYLTQQAWATRPEHMLFVFHVRKVCEQLDNGGLEKAAMSGAYLNAIKGLEQRRPGAKPNPAPASTGEDDDGEQTTIFDHMDE